MAVAVSSTVVALHAAPAKVAADRELVRACASGDATALAALFDRLHRDVFRFAARLVGAADPDLDDLVQTTFVTAWGAAAGYRGEAEVRTWLFGICANVCRRHQRWHFRRRRAFVALAEADALEVMAGEEALDRQKTLERVAVAMANLPHAWREAFVLCDVEGISGVDAATSLGIPAGTLGRRLFEARRRLRRDLGGGEP